MTKVREVRWVVVGLASALLATGCCRQVRDLGGDDDSTDPAPSLLGSSAAPAGSAPVAVEDPGPIVTLPAGTLVAGMPCQSTPRITNEELEGVDIHLDSFTIDLYPYPNDPTKPPLTNVSRDEAQQMCAARGRRLCSELEWERACKGPSNTAYEYGNQYRAGVCAFSTTLLKPVGQYDKCASGFGVKAMHGVVWEWTASDWSRGGVGGMATVRGGGTKSPTVQGRCSNGQMRSPSEKAADLGFRCCGGPRNAPEVSLSLRQQTPLSADSSVDRALASRLLSVLPSKMRDIPGVDVSIERIWRWHPRDNEEVIVARYVGKRTAMPPGSFFNALVFHLCGNSTVLLAKLRGPVERMDPPAVGGNPQQLSVKLKTGEDEDEAQVRYSYGSVNVAQPDWVKEGVVLTPRIRLPRLVPVKRK